MPDSGLPPPSFPTPKAPSIPRGPDLETGFTKDALAGVVDMENSNTGIRTPVTAGPGKPTFTPFGSSPATNALRPVTSTLEKAVDASSPEAALAKFLGKSLASPFTSAVDEYQVAKIRAAQEKFYADHDVTLTEMAKNLSNARAGMRDLGKWLSQQHIPDNNIRGIMQQKSSAGNRAMSDLNDALSSATDPDDRAKLEAMKADSDKWTKDRDERLKPEWKEETDLENRIDKINRDIGFGQANSLMTAAQSDGPHVETGGGKVISSSVQQPEALAYVQSLRNFLLGSRSQTVSTIKGVL